MHQHHGHRFNDVERLRSPERLAWLEVNRVVDQAMQGIPVTTVLDIGTGSGIFAEAFADTRCAVSGIDPNPQMLEAARNYVPDGDFREGTAEAIPFPANAFDLVFMGLVLHETDDVSKSLKETYRVAKKRLVILEWPFVQQDFGPGLEERLSEEQVKALAAEAGFQHGETLRLDRLVLYRFEKAGSNGKV